LERQIPLFKRLKQLLAMPIRRRISGFELPIPPVLPGLDVGMEYYLEIGPKLCHIMLDDSVNFYNSSALLSAVMNLFANLSKLTCHKYSYISVTLTDRHNLRLTYRHIIKKAPFLHRNFFKIHPSPVMTTRIF